MSDINKMKTDDNDDDENLSLEQPTSNTPKPEDDAVEPSWSPLDFIPYAEGANVVAGAGKAAADAIAPSMERLVGNEIGSIDLPGIQNLMNGAGSKVPDSVATAAYRNAANIADNAAVPQTIQNAAETTSTLNRLRDLDLKNAANAQMAKQAKLAKLKAMMGNGQ